MEASVKDTIRLDRWISDMTGFSRKDIGRMIRRKRVTVDGETVRDSACAVDPAADTVELDGRPVPYEAFQYFMVNKPAGVLSATEDKKRPTVMELLPKAHRRDLFPAGRLDIDTTGLILMTNDGELAHRLLSPSWHVDKCYVAETDGILDERDVQTFARGISVEEDLVFAPAALVILRTDRQSGRSTAQVTIHEGKFHQVKKMFEAVGCPVISLKRVSFGPLTLGNLPEGAARRLTEEEIRELKFCTQNRRKDERE
jgi:16S rRNA pseudouridine516 synthase